MQQVVGDVEMIKNNIELDVKVKCIEQETTQSRIAENIGTTKSYVNRIIKRPEGVVNKTFVQMMESLGYDIELTYVKRGMAYHLGYPETRDDREAFLWASRAADAGDGSTMYQTAYLYENGFDTDRDIDAALLLYTEAAEQGVRSAMIRLYEIYTEGLLHIQPDGKKAAHYLWLSGEGRD